MKVVKQPWKTISSREVYQNPWISVEHHDVINPSGKPGIYGKISFKNLAIGIIPLDDQLNTWIVGQYRYPLKCYSWEIPMGGGPLGEDMLIAAQRELKEETGITAKEWQHILKAHVSNCVSDEEGHVFIARNLSIGSTAFDETEDLTIRKLPFKELFAMVMNCEITDLLSVAGVLKASQLLGSFLLLILTLNGI